MLLSIIISQPCLPCVERALLDATGGPLPWTLLISLWHPGIQLLSYLLLLQASTPLMVGTAAVDEALGGARLWRSSLEGGVVSCARPEVVSSRAATRLPIMYGTSSSPASGRTCSHPSKHQQIAYY